MHKRPLLMIPGPIEFDPDVLEALGRATPSHVAPAFIEVFGRALEQMREVWLCPDGQPFIISRREPGRAGGPGPGDLHGLFQRPHGSHTGALWLPGG